MNYYLKEFTHIFGLDCQARTYLDFLKLDGEYDTKFTIF